MKVVNTILWIVYFTLWISLMNLFISCGKDDDNNDETSFDRPAMLQNMGNEIILPAYRTALTETKALLDRVNQFTASPDEALLSQTKAQFTVAYLAWQDINLFEFGPAMQQSLKSNLNIYPTDTTKINANIQTGIFELDILQNKAAKGFPALEYLLFGSDPASTVIKFNDANRKTYLKTIAQDIKDKIENAELSWSPSGGSHLNTFVSQSGTDVGSSLGELVNAFNQHFERNFLDAKIGIPVGIRSAGIARPTEVESYYQGISVQLALKNLEAIENIYLGKDGLGLDDHLDAVDAGELNNSIKQQLQLAKTTLEGIGDPLSATIVSDEAKVLAAYQELKKLVALFKSEMPSRLGVLITYQDNDGD